MTGASRADQFAALFPARHADHLLRRRDRDGRQLLSRDRNGVRTPMQWTPDRNAGFSVPTPSNSICPRSSTRSIITSRSTWRTSRRSPSSLFWWMRRLLAIRQQWAVFGRGRIEFLHPENAKVLAYLRAMKTRSFWWSPISRALPKSRNWIWGNLPGGCPKSFLAIAASRKSAPAPAHLPWGRTDFIGWPCIRRSRANPGRAPGQPQG